MQQARSGPSISYVGCVPQECTLKVQDGKFKLQDLLVVPMQRVLKYHLLLKVSRCACSTLHACQLQPIRAQHTQSLTAAGMP